MTTKISGLSFFNVEALGLAVAVEDAPVVPTATTAEWTLGWTPADAIAWLDRVMAQMPRRGHPRASLHAVRRRLLALAAQPAAPSATTPEEETMTTSTITRAEIEKRRRAAKKQAAETGGTVERRGDEFVVVTEELRHSSDGDAIAVKITPVQELPASDVAPADGQALAATLRDRVAAAIQGAELVAAPSGAEHRVRLSGRTLGYITPQKRSVRVHLTGADGQPKIKVATIEEIDAAIAALDELARATAS